MSKHKSNAASFDYSRQRLGVKAHNDMVDITCIYSSSKSNALEKAWKYKDLVKSHAWSNMEKYPSLCFLGLSAPINPGQDHRVYPGISQQHTLESSPVHCRRALQTWPNMFGTAQQKPVHFPDRGQFGDKEHDTKVDFS